MIWLTWRQHRGELTVGGILLSCIALFLLVTGLKIKSAYQSMEMSTCVAQNMACQLKMVRFAEYVQTVFGGQMNQTIFIVVLLSIPLLAGLFIGTQIVAREVETGTYRLLWTQSILWSKWLFAKTSILTAIIVCGITCFCILMWWWSQPIIAAAFSGWDYYDIRGIVPPVYSVFALVLGITAGALIRKTVPAMAVTLLLFVTLRLVITLLWRPYFLPPQTLAWSYEVQSPQTPHQAWIITQGSIDRQGSFISDLALSQICNNPTTQQTSQQYAACMATQGIHYKIIYQPAERFWLFQAIECGVYLVLTLLLLVLTFCWMKRKVT